MKKRKVKVDGEEYDVELEKQDGVWNVTIEGKSFNIEIEGSSVGETSGSKRKRSARGKKSVLFPQQYRAKLSPYRLKKDK